MNIWDTENSFYKLSNIIEEDIRFVENHFDITLPESYIDLLNIQNGGSINFNALAFEDDYIPIDHLLGITKSDGIMQTDHLKQEWEINRDNIIIISGDGHSFIALDYNSSSNPTITHIKTEEYTRITKIFDTFDKMVANLVTIEVTDNITEALDFTIEEVKKLLNSSLSEDIIKGLIMWQHLDYVSFETVFLYNKLLSFIELNDENLKDIVLTVVHVGIEQKHIQDMNFLQSFVTKLQKTTNNNPFDQFYIDFIIDEIEKLR